MHLRQNILVIAGICLAGLLPGGILTADEFNFVCGSPPACGNVCRLVCETKKLTAVCYACECDEICIPGPSRPGCKHCATCGIYSRCGEWDPACNDCQGHTPACEFCWRDWFACGCAKPRTVKLLTKYQAEKEIAWYRWEVIDAACCEHVTDRGTAGPHRSIYKPAPADAEAGDVFAVSDEEWAELAAILKTDDAAASQLADRSGATPADDSNAPAAESAIVSFARKITRAFTK